MYDKFVKKVDAIKTNDASDLVKKADYDTKIDEIKRKIHDHDKYVTTTEINKLRKEILLKD